MSLSKIYKIISKVYKSIILKFDNYLKKIC